MKFGLLITDLTKEEVGQVMGKLTPLNITAISEVEKPAAPEAPAAPQPTAATLPTPPGVSSNDTTNAPSVPETPKNDVEVDADGLPWDERIHAGSKKQNKDGTWKRKRGLQDFEYDEVVAELKGATVEQPVAPEAPAAPQPAPSRDFQGLMTQISNLFQDKKIEPDYPQTIVDRVNNGFGVTLGTITDVANDERMVEYAWQCLEVDGKAA